MNSPPERIQRVAAGAAWIRPAQAFAVDLDEALALGCTKAVQDRTKPRRLDPFEHRILALEPLQILRLPRVDGLRLRGEQVVVLVRIEHPLASDRGRERVVTEPRAVHAAVGEGLAHQHVRRHRVAERHLHREASAGRHESEEPRKEGRVIVDPVQRGIGVDHLRRPLRLPVRDVGLDPLDTARRLGRLGEHVARNVDAGHAGAGEPLGDDPRHVARAAPEVADERRAGDRHPIEKLQCRAQSVVGEPVVLAGVPVGAGGTGGVGSGHPRPCTTTGHSIRFPHSCQEAT